MATSKGTINFQIVIESIQQAGHTAQVDPAKQQHQGDGHCQTQAAEHLNTASIFGEPGMLLAR